MIKVKIRFDVEFLYADNKVCKDTWEHEYSAPDFEIAKYLADSEMSKRAVDFVVGKLGESHAIKTTRYWLNSLECKETGESYYGQLPRHYSL